MTERMIDFINADAVQWANDYTGELFHAAFMDAPYEMEFMGKDWDGSGVAFDPETWKAFAKVLHPGAFLFVFAGTINDDLISVAMREAGLRKFHKMAGWVYGSGFPKATRVDTQIDKAGGDPEAWRKFAAAYDEAVKKSSHNHSDIDRHLGIKSSSCYWVRTDERGGLPPRHHWEKVRDLLGLNGNLQRLYDAAEREVVGTQTVNGEEGTCGGYADGIASLHGLDTNTNRQINITAPATPLAQAFAGHRYGLQALKPAIEMVLIFQKPYDGKPVDSITRTGAGVLNVDGGRIGTESTLRPDGKNKGATSESLGDGWHGNGISGSTNGRWPANFYVDAEAARRLDAQSGVSVSTGGLNPHKDAAQIFAEDANRPYFNYGDKGGASRFFLNVAEQIDDADPVRYVAKASRRERDAGLEGFEGKEVPDFKGKMAEWQKERGRNPDQYQPMRNPHPTVKPLALTRYLATLLLPPAEYAPRRLFVPFAGVGSEAIGGHQAGWEFVQGVEITEEYLPIAQARAEYWTHKEAQMIMEFA